MPALLTLFLPLLIYLEFVPSALMLFVARIGGGLAPLELAGSVERRESRKRQDDLIESYEKLPGQLRELKGQSAEVVDEQSSLRARRQKLAYVLGRDVELLGFHLHQDVKEGHGSFEVDMLKAEVINMLKGVGHVGALR